MTTEFIRRPNRCEYRSTGRPKRWHKAVGSHSSYGPRNSAAYSRFIPNEDFMSHTERKAFLLPCGNTLGDSWGALRKAWQAFKISNSQDNTDSKREYARIIRKLQLEMGIEQTPFDPDLLDEETIWIIEMEVKMLEKAMAEKIIDEGRATSTNYIQRERSCDYDTLLAEGKKEILSNNLPPPNEGMFAEYFGRENGCYLKSKDITDTATAAELIESKHYDNRSVDNMLDDPDVTANPKPYSKGMKKRRNVCYQRDKPIDNSEDNKRKSCPYKAEANPGQN